MFIDSSYLQPIQGKITYSERLGRASFHHIESRFKFIRDSSILHNSSNDKSFLVFPQLFWEQRSVVQACFAMLLSAKVWLKVATAVVVIGLATIFSVGVIVNFVLPTPLSEKVKSVALFCASLMSVRENLKDFRESLKSAFENSLRPKEPAGIVVFSEDNGVTDTVIERLQNERIDDCFLMPGTDIKLTQAALKSPRTIVINDKAYDAPRMLMDYLYSSCEKSDEVFFKGLSAGTKEESRNKLFKYCARLLLLDEAIIKEVCEKPFDESLRMNLRLVANFAVANYYVERGRSSPRSMQLMVSQANNPDGFPVLFSGMGMADYMKYGPAIEEICVGLMRAKPILKHLSEKTLEKFFNHSLTALQKGCLRAVMAENF